MSRKTRTATVPFVNPNVPVPNPTPEERGNSQFVTVTFGGQPETRTGPSCPVSSHLRIVGEYPTDGLYLASPIPGFKTPTTVRRDAVGHAVRTETREVGKVTGDGPTLDGYSV